MTYNTCKTCLARDGRAGILIGGECRNCRDTRKAGQPVVHAELIRTCGELRRTIQIVEERV